jgi:DNA-binding FadR family transcriptional regulator
MTGQTNPDGLSGFLEERILAGELQSGVKLPSERQLASEFGVSRPVVREALRSLSERNLVLVLPGRGTYVRQVRATDAARPVHTVLQRQQATPRDLLEARKMLECEAASLAAARATEDELETMRWTIQQIDASRNLIERARYDITFHMAVARAAHNPVIETMLSSISGLMIELMLRSLGDPEVASAGLPYHHEILEAIRDRDRDRARAAMSDHLSVAEKLYGEDFKRSLDGIAQRELNRLLGPEATLQTLIAAAQPVNQEIEAKPPAKGRSGV